MRGEKLHILFPGAAQNGKFMDRGAGTLMDKLEDIGRRLEEEFTRLRHYIEEEVAPETERRTAQFLREVSQKLTQTAAKLETRNAARNPKNPSSS